jgi:predicted permease
VIAPALLSLSVLALCCGLLYVFMGYLVNRNRDREQQSFAMLNLPGYNVGNFVIPFAQSFLGASGVIAVSIFDTGNAAICLGGAYSLAAMVKDGNRFSLGRILRALLRSVPFVTYMLMLLMNQNGAGFDMSNPMMMYLALSSSSEDKNMLPLLMMMSSAASTPQEHKCTCHEHCNTRGCDTCEDEHPAQ